MVFMVIFGRLSRMVGVILLMAYGYFLYAGLLGS
jgi:hypothetical protein